MTSRVYSPEQTLADSHRKDFNNAFDTANIFIFYDGGLLIMTIDSYFWQT